LVHPEPGDICVLPFATFLIFGTLWFWVAIAIFTIAMLALIEYEKPFSAFLVIAVTLSMFEFGAGYDLFAWVVSNPLLTVEFIVGYIVLGIMWSIAKWFFFVLNARDRYSAKRQQWLKDLKLGETLEQYIIRARPSAYDQFPPSPVANRDRIILWMAYWPFSALWTLINDPLKRIWRFTFNRITAFLTWISNRAFADFHELKDGK